MIYHINSETILVDLNHFIITGYEDATQDLVKLHLYDKDFNDKDVYNLCTHHIVHELYKLIQRELQRFNKTVFYINTNISTTDIKYKFIKKQQNLIPSLIPAQYIRHNLSFEDFISSYKKREVKTIEIIDRLKHKISKNSNKTLNLSHITKRLKTRGLKQLSTDYFSKTNNKLIVLNK